MTSSVRPRDRITAGLTACVLTVFGLFVAGNVSEWRLRAQPTNEWFQYYAVDFKAVEGDALVMVSTAERFVPVDEIRWIDELRCDGRIFSTQTTAAADLPPSDLGSTEWVYAARIPHVPSTCFMRSTITVFVNGVAKATTIESGEFNLGDKQ